MGFLLSPLDPSSRSLRCAAAVVTVCFVVTCLVLHMCLEHIEQTDLLLVSAGESLLLQTFRRVTQDQRASLSPRLVPRREAVGRSASAATTTDSHTSLRQAKSPTKRQVFEATFPPDDLERTKRVVEGLRVPDPAVPTQDLSYDIYHCPDTPPAGYPHHWRLHDILQDWNPDDTEIPAMVYNSLCVFDHATDEPRIHAYRQAEVPFVLRNHPEVLRTTERWNHPDYLLQLVGAHQPQRNEYSRTNHFMFWRTRGLSPQSIPRDWKPPTEVVPLTLDDWMRKAQALEETVTQGESYQQTDREHWYFRLNGAFRSMNHYLYEELPIFRPDAQGSPLFMVDPDQERGINCRFGMRGVIAESHFDPTRNWILLLGGHRRYILNHPRECPHLELYPLGHPSARHSAVDWSRDVVQGAGALATKAMAHEVVLQPGDALYLPTSWFHYIVSLDINYQCNARSGVTTENHRYLHECGFPV